MMAERYGKLPSEILGTDLEEWSINYHAFCEGLKRNKGK